MKDLVQAEGTLQYKENRKLGGGDTEWCKTQRQDDANKLNWLLAMMWEGEVL